MSSSSTGDNVGEEVMKKKVVVIGNGMVGQRFMEDILDLQEEQSTRDDGNDNGDSTSFANRLELVTFCEEPRAAYNRVRLTSYFESRDPSALSMTSEFDSDGRTSWYEENNVELFLNDKAVALDTDKQEVTSSSGRTLKYDYAVLATGSYPFVPPIPGSKNRPGVFVYRTIEDLEAMLDYANKNNVKSAAVIGGGLLGLEAAKAVHDMESVDETHIIEFAPVLMCRQIDEGGHNALVQTIEEMGLKVHCNARTEAFIGQQEEKEDDISGSSDEPLSPIAKLRFSNEGWDDLDVQMVVVSAGIKPRDEIARQAGIQVGERGGIVVDESMQTSAKNVYAIGECALYNNFIYGLVAPGYDMAKACAHDVVSKEFENKQKQDGDGAYLFKGADLSTKLKLLGCDVASFGVNQPKADDVDVSNMVWNDPVSRIYRKLIFNKDGTKLRGGILVGDAGDYNKLHKLAMSDTLTTNPATLLAPPSALTNQDQQDEDGDDENAQVCSCNDVSRQSIQDAVKSLTVEGATLAAVKKCTRAGTGCGGCEPLLKKVLTEEVSKLGGSVSNHMCEHFEYSRQELMAKIRCDPDISSVDSFDKILAKYGHGDGCETCKPAVGSILASLVNGVILKDGREALQDTNDRSMANMQRGGTYSVVPRVPGGELSPDQLIALGDTAKKYQLYTKITGAQRVDLFGAAKYQLPDIWEDLGKAGFESGHAYGKALRTVKSCVGSTWCRYGVQDSVSFAVQVENRYKGVRSPHKMKSAVSGCARECAEAQSKDFGMIATENGYNLYVGGNGGAIPVHAQLLAADIDEETVLKYLDRYIMYYILTADKLERTATWQAKLPSGKNGGGPIEHLKEVIIHDSLQICDELDKRMQHLVDTYHDEWAEVVHDPNLRKKFKQFVNTDVNQERQELIDFVDIRGQTRPADWPADGQPQTNWKPPTQDIFANSQKTWVNVGNKLDFPPNVGSAILYGTSQLAIFNNEQRNEWYATQNMCPHKQAFVLSQGILGDANNVPKVACPLHKKTFDLKTGKQLNVESNTNQDDELNIITFPVKIDDHDNVLVYLPAIDEVDAILGTNGLRVQKSDCINLAQDAIKIALKSEQKQKRKATSTTTQLMAKSSDTLHDDADEN
eukprot:CAMPEP_0184862660 /NCGR_PEP_ID=MMETSP0580-20130426/7082_1 /TAXON_ID=1118495 /ORGANISM="Dactyliosolen fragilissimus" /LENGTH=1124 /DNA_ID=CAMNT_0027360613 /DNA_START=342 /DNA_END=3716 /DNA_ORIENTATION=-